MYNLPASQIGEYNNQIPKGAVDLDVNSCAQPEAPEGKRGWWSIDLLKEYVITTVIVFNGNTGK